MGRKRSISTLGPQHTILSYRAAAELARAMRAEGWPLPAKLLQRSTPHRIARKLAPRDPEAQARLEARICKLAGLVPPDESAPAVT